MGIESPLPLAGGVQVTGKTNRQHRPSARLDFLSMPIGKFRGMPIREMPEIAPDYSDWLVAQPWFGKRYPDESLALARAIKAWADPAHRRRIAEERRRAFEAREAELQARRERREQEWHDRHKVTYDERGVMPFGKYKDQPLAVAAADEPYCRWFAGSTYGRVNPELAADLAALARTFGRASVETERQDGGCSLIAFRTSRIVRHRTDGPNTARPAR
jgi:uncharacterized protein (DUF3820 family)